jgi:hypothetical protein
VDLAYYTSYSFKDIEAVVKKLAFPVVKSGGSNQKNAQSKFLKISCRPER